MDHRTSAACNLVPARRNSGRRRVPRHLSCPASRRLRGNVPLAEGTRRPHFRGTVKGEAAGNLPIGRFPARTVTGNPLPEKKKRRRKPPTEIFGKGLTTRGKCGMIRVRGNTGDGYFLRLVRITARHWKCEGGYFFLLNDRMTKIVVTNDSTTPENCISCSKVM